MLHLGSPITTTCSTISDDDRVIFADPCTMCGTKKRRISPVQPISFKPRKKKAIRSFSFPSSHSSPLPPSLPESKKPSDSFLAFPSPIPTQTPSPSPPQPEVPFLGHFNSFSSSSGTPPRSAERPPRPPILSRSVSELSPKTVTPVLRRTVSSPTRVPRCEETAFLTSSGDGASPIESKWKRIKKHLAEMNDWVDDLIQEPQTEEQQIIISPQNTSCESEEENVRLEKDGAAYKLMNKCCCGKRYQIVFSILPV